jgi:hypothetical protein
MFDAVRTTLAALLGLDVSGEAIQDSLQTLPLLLTGVY